IYGQSGESLVEALSFSFTTAPFVPANVTLSSDVSNINEDGGQAVLTLTLSEALELPVSVELSFGGSATESADFISTANSVNLAAGETSASVTLTAQQDVVIEGSEDIEVSISQVTNAVELAEQMLTITLVDDDKDSNNDGFPDKGFIINEVLFDPPSGEAGDANGDGTRSASADEFIEFINDSDREVDLSNFTLYDANNLESLSPRHTFSPGTLIPAGGVYVLFGGGSPSGDFGTAQVAVSTTGNMNLTNSDDVITILDTEGNVFLTFDTQGEGTGLSFGSDQSITRFPDINGDYTLHNTANASLDYSPGKKTDGSNIDGGGDRQKLGFIINELLFDPPSGEAGDANGDGTRSASADEFIEFVNDSDQAVDLSGFTLFDATNLATNTPRHTFPNGTIIPPGGVYVLFGGGTPTGDFGGAQVGVSTTGNMNLSNSDDVITILDGSGNVFLTFDTQVDGVGVSFGSDQSVTRGPDLDGNFVLHMTANASLLFSPG
ncbi:MAG: lamin tail domain-containing protein, partial [Bacteroidota bacterium]